MWRAYKNARPGSYSDRHHAHMAKNYKEAPWWWYITVLVFSFVLGLVVVIKENITLPAWAYVLSLLLGIFMAPLVINLSLQMKPTSGRHSLILAQSTLLYSRFGNGIATNNLSKMMAGLILPERPVGNMYFAAWSHNVISNTVTLCNDLKMGQYRGCCPFIKNASVADSFDTVRFHPGSCSSPKFMGLCLVVSSIMPSWLES